MTLKEFHNCLRVLRSIDLHELQAVGLWTEAVAVSRDDPATTHVWALAWGEWRMFRDNPYEFFICCDDKTADKIWAAVQKRLKPDETLVAEAIGKLPRDMVVTISSQELTVEDCDGYVERRAAHA